MDEKYNGTIDNATQNLKLIHAMPFYSDVEAESDTTTSLTYRSYEREQTSLLRSGRKSLGYSSESVGPFQFSDEMDIETTHLIDTGNSHNGRPTPSKGRYVAVMLACMYLHFSCFGLVVAFGVIYVELISEFDSPRSEAALVQSLFFGLILVSSVIFTKVIIKYDTGICVIIASIIGSAALTAGSFATNIGTVIALVSVVAGLATSIHVMSAPCVINWIFVTNRKLALSVMTLGSTIGQTVLPFISTALVEKYYWSGCLMILSAMTLLNGMVCGVIIQCSKRYFHKPAPRDAKSSHRIYLDMLTDGAFMVFLTAAFIFPMLGPVEQWFAVDLAVLKGFTKEDGATILSLNGMFGFVSRALGAVILKLRPDTRAELHMSCAFFLWAVAHFAFVEATTYWGMMLAMALRGLSSGIVISYNPALEIELRGPDQFPETLAVTYLLSGVSQTLGGFLGGYSVDVTGSYNLIFYIATGSFVYCSLSMIIVHVIFRVRKSRSISYQKL